MPESTQTATHKHEWRDTGKREVRWCPTCERTEIKSLATLRWYEYKAADDLGALLEERARLREVCKLAIANEAKVDELRGTGLVDDVEIKALRAIAKAARAALSGPEEGQE